MAVTVVTKGFIEVYRDGQKVSQHTVETKAIESALAHADEFGDGTYELRFPRKDLSRITKTVIPFIWQSQPALSFTQGTAKTVQLRGTYLFDPQSRVKTITVASGSLPAGCAINGTSVVYDGTGAAATTSFTLTASDGTYSQTSSSGSATIEAVATNNPPVWTVPDNYQLPQFSTAGGTFNLDTIAFDAEGDPMAFTRTGGTAPGSVTVSDGVLTVPAGLTAGSYTVTVDLSQALGTAEQDWIIRSTGPGVVWAHDFRNAAEFTNFHERQYGFRESPPGSGNWIDDYIAQPGGLESSGSAGISTLSRLASAGIAGANSGALRVTVPHGFSATATSANSYPSGTYADSGTGGSNDIHFIDGTSAVWTGEKSKAEYRVATGSWVRPFAALNAGQNGLATPDPAAGGTVTRRAWDTTNRQTFGTFRGGFYGPQDLWGTFGTTASQWDGTEFYLQMRVRFSVGRHGYIDSPPGSLTPVMSQSPRPGRIYAAGGKLIWIVDNQGNDSEWITVSGGNQGIRYDTDAAQGLGVPFQTYTNRPSETITYPFLGPSGYPNGRTEPGGPYDACDIDNNRGACWRWPEGQWVTLLFWMKPGHQAGAWQPDNMRYPQDTYFRVYMAEQGQTTYTDLFKMPDGTGRWWRWDGGDAARVKPEGYFNFLMLNGYMNNTPSVVGFTQEYTQIIFSKSFIPCPQV